MDDTVRRRTRELEILNAIADALNRPVDLGDSLRIALAKVAELFDLETGWVFLLDQETGHPYLAASQNLPPALAEAPKRMTGSCYCLDTFRAGDLNGAANVNVITCSRLKWLLSGTEGLRYHSTIPLYASGRKLGVMNLASRDWRELSGADLRLLYTIGDLLGIAIERAQLFAQSVRVGVLEERNRLAREIHDTIAQGLAAIAMQLETADALLESEAPKESVRSTIARALALTRSSLDEARRSVLDLRAAPLEERHLAEALEDLVRRWKLEQKISVSLDLLGTRPLPVRVEVGLYRIAQEALNNIAAHAGAHRVTLRLMMTPDRILLSIQDDGRGFDTATAGHERHGLVGMSERARLLGGTLRIESTPGEGTRIETDIPFSSIEA
jgi:two-component system NarL family sensor kinase